MGDGTTVSATPLEWRSRVRAVSQAHPVVFYERDIGRRLLLLREALKPSACGEGRAVGRAKRSVQHQLVGQRSK